MGLLEDVGGEVFEGVEGGGAEFGEVEEAEGLSVLVPLVDESADGVGSVGVDDDDAGVCVVGEGECGGGEAVGDV